MKKRAITLLLAAVLLLALLPTQFATVQAVTTVTPQYVKENLGDIQVSKTSTTLWKRYVQGMAISEKNLYSAMVYSKYTKKASASSFPGTATTPDAYVHLVRSIIGGSGTTNLTYDGSANLKMLGHANDMCAFKYGSYTYILVTHGMNKDSNGKVVGDRLVLLKVSGTKIVEYRNYYMRNGSNPIKVTGITRSSGIGATTTFMMANYNNIFKFTLNLGSLPKGGSKITLTKVVSLNKDTISKQVKAAFGKTYTYGSGSACWNFQGITYNGGKIYVPVFAHANDVTFSCYVVFDTKGAVQKTVKIKPSMELEALDFSGSAIYFSAISWQNAYTTYKGYSSKVFRQ